MTSRDASKGTIVVKHFSCVISSELKIFACCKKHMSYFSSGYLHLITPVLYTISLASKLLKCNEFFFIFDFLMNVKIGFHISHRQKRPVKYINSLLRHHYLSFIKPHVPLVLCMNLYLRIISNCKIPSF